MSSARTTSARILAHVTLEAALGRHPALALHDAIRDHLAAEPTHRNAPPAQWANMTVWTTHAPAGPRPAAPAWESWTTALTARAPGEDRYAAFDMALLAAILATDNADWASFATGADLPALPAAAQQASREEDAQPSVITLDLDHQVRVTGAVSSALRWAERLASHLQDPVIAPAHMVYGFLCHDSCDAARWMLTSSHDVPELHAVLSDRVFGVDLPPASGLPALDTKPRLVRPLKTRRTPPRTSREVLGIIASDSYGDVLTTLDFTGAVAAADGAAWQQLTRSGSRLSPPDTDPFRERGHGGVEISLGGSNLPSGASSRNTRSSNQI